MSRSTIFALAKSPTGRFGTSAGPVVARLFFGDLHRGRGRERNKYGKRELLRLDSQLSHHSKILSLF
jgi:hypothetical protein